MDDLKERLRKGGGDSSADLELLDRLIGTLRRLKRASAEADREASELASSVADLEENLSAATDLVSALKAEEGAADLLALPRDLFLPSAQASSGFLRRDLLRMLETEHKRETEVAQLRHLVTEEEKRVLRRLADASLEGD